MPTEPTYPGVYVQEVPSGVRTIAGVPTSVAVFIGPTIRGFANRPHRVTGFAAFERSFGGLVAALETGYAVRQFFANGGTEAWVVRVARNPGPAQIGRALESLTAVENFDLLAIPGITEPSLLAAALAQCERRGALLLIDSPVTGADGGDPVGAMAGAADGVALPGSPHAAVYFPWLRIADPLNNGAQRLTPPSGTIAGIIARTDSQRGVWKAPAGVEAILKGAVGLACNPSDADIKRLSPLGVNCLRAIPPSGIVCWGARTLAGADSLASEWKYIPVRRTASFIEQSLLRSTQWAVFEPNGEPLWAQLRLNIGAFMHALFRQGAFQGSTPRDACFVKCDRETTTQADIDRGVVNVVVGFAPLKPAEFVLVKLQVAAAPAQD